MKPLSRLVSACASTYLTVQVVGVLAGAPCIVLYRYHGSTIRYAFGAMAGAVLCGVIVTFLPALCYAVALTAVIHRGVRKDWPTWILYIVSVGLMTLLFFVLVSLTSRPIPDIAMYFIPQAPDVQRPALSASEIPLLVTSIVAGLLGAWVCVRVLRRGSGEKDAQQPAGP